MGHHRNIKRYLTPFLLFWAAMGVRGFYLWQSRANPAFAFPVVDAAGYDQMARALLANGTFGIEFFWQQCFYPMVLTAIYAISDGSILFAKIVQAVIGSLTCAMVGALAMAMMGTLFARRAAMTAGIIAGLGMAMYGPAILHELELTPAVWVSFWMVTLLTLAWRYREKLTTTGAVLLGVTAAMAILTRPNFILVAAGVAGFILWQNRGVRTATMWRGALAVGVMMIVLLPAAWINYTVTGHGSVLPASGGLNVYIGNHPDFDAAEVRPGSSWNRIIALPLEANVPRDMFAGNDYFMTLSSQRLAADPAGVLRGLMSKSFQVVCSREMTGNIDSYFFARYSPLMRRLMWKVRSFGFPFGVLFALAVMGMAWGMFSHKANSGVIVMMLVGAVVLYAVPLIVGHVEARYRLGIVAPLMMMAVMGILGLWQWLNRRRWIAVVALIALGIGGAVLGSVPGPFAPETLNIESGFYRCVGTKAQEFGDEDAAMRFYEKAIAVDPNNADAHDNLGVLLKQQGDLHEAAEHFAAAITLMPDYPGTRYNYAGLLMDVGADEQAMGQLKKAVALRESHYQAQTRLAQLYVKAGQYALAMDHARRALAVDPDYVPALSQLGIALARAGKTDEAVATFDEALKADENNADVLGNLAIVYLQAGDMEKAAQRLAAAVAIDPNRPDDWFNLAGVYVRTKRLDQAVAAMEHYCQLRGDDPAGWMMLGRCRAMNGDTTGAKDALQKAKMLAPGDTRIDAMLRRLR